jgi:hypothetical protein
MDIEGLQQAAAGIPYNDGYVSFTGEQQVKKLNYSAPVWLPFHALSGLPGLRLEVYLFSHVCLTVFHGTVFHILFHSLH